jgi:hypothetical protein
VDSLDRVGRNCPFLSAILVELETRTGRCDANVDNFRDILRGAVSKVDTSSQMFKAKTWPEVGLAGILDFEVIQIHPTLHI